MGVVREPDPAGVALLLPSAVASVKTCYFLQPIFEGEPLPPAALGFPKRPMLDALPEMTFVDAAMFLLGPMKKAPQVTCEAAVNPSKE